jgi:hypothetical protein
MQALMYGMEPDYECRDMEQSMAHHRDPNVPLRLDAATLFEFEHDEEIVGLNARIADLSRRIAGQPSIHKSLAEERSRLYTQEAKDLRESDPSIFHSGGKNATKDTSLERGSLNVLRRTCSRSTPNISRLELACAKTCSKRYLSIVRWEDNAFRTWSITVHQPRESRTILG